jgi:hypothetical protein
MVRVSFTCIISATCLQSVVNRACGGKKMLDFLKHRWILVGRTAEMGNAPSEFSSEPVTHF